MKRFLRNIIGVVCFGVLCQDSHAQFIDVTEEQGIDNINEGCLFGNGLSFYDFNHDGWDDLSMANGAEEPLFLINNNGQFEPANLNLTISPVGQVEMLLWADYDNDGDSDLLCTQLDGRLDLWQNDGAFNFTNVASAAGLQQGNYKFWGAAFGDYDHDGCLDLYVAKYYDWLNNFNPNHQGLLYHNNCDGTFTDVTETAGVELGPRAQFQPAFFDYDRNGWEDLFLVIDRNVWDNEMFRNNEDGTFTNVSAATGLDWAFNAMTTTMGDYDNDLDMDIYMTDGYQGNKLFQNQGDGTFIQVATAAGVLVNLVSWGSLWIDYDNNTWQDLFVGTAGNLFLAAQNYFFVNNQDGTFTQSNELAGILGDDSPSMSSCMGDMNNDGYYDFLNNQNDPFPSKLYLNDGGDNNYLGVYLTGVFANRDGIGSWIDCYAGGNHYINYTHCGENLVCQNSGKEIFGLAQFEIVDSLVVSWNSGTIDKFYDVPVNQHMHIIEGMSFAQPFNIISDGDLYLCSGESVVLDGGEYVSHLWNNGDTTRYLTISEAGTYDVTVTDNFGNEFDSYPITVYSHPTPEVMINVDGISCYGANDGSIEVTLLNGEIQDINWDNSYITPVINNLVPGIYHCTGTDLNGCIFSAGEVLEEPDSLFAIATVEDVLCYGSSSGTAALEITGGTGPYQTDWQGVDNFSIAAGEYVAVLTDSSGCIDSIEYVITEPSELLVEYYTTNVTCYGYSDGTVSLQISGGIPSYSIFWQELDSLAMTAGLHQCLVVDSNGCTVLTEFEIGSPEIMEVDLETTAFYENGEAGSAEANVSGGTPPYSFDWGSGTTESSAQQGLLDGDYVLLVVDSNGCSISMDFEIEFIVSNFEYDQSELVIVSYQSDGNIGFSLNEKFLGADVSVIDSRGRMVLLENANGTSYILNTGVLNAGVYVARIISKDRSQVAKMKFIVLDQH